MEPIKVSNCDVADLANRVVRWAKELKGLQSAFLDFLSDREIPRILSYIDKAKEYLSTFGNDPNPMDLPHTYPAERLVDPFLTEEEIIAVVNPTIRSVIVRLQMLYGELAASQSGRQASSFVAPDRARFEELLENAREVVRFGELAVDQPEDALAKKDES